MVDRAEVQDSLLAAFRQEFQGDLAAVRREWEAYKPSRKTRVSHLPELRRILHTIKGSTRLLGFEGVPEQVHELEELVLEALRKRKKPETFLDALADLEETVARVAGLEETVVELDSVELSASLSLGTPGAATSPAYSFLLSVDELLSMSLSLAEALFEERAGPLAHRAALLSERTRAVRDEARRMALVPSSDLFLGLTELARRTAAEQGRTVRVSHQIQADRLERDVVLSLRPALLHLVGNAVSHGATEDGEVTFGFRRRSDRLVVWVADNGPGLDRQALGRAAVSDGHLSDEAWGNLSEHEQLQWIFQPGLSTRSEADLSAGRGMGLAVVAETVQRLGGQVEVESSAAGTEFRLLIPVNWNLRSVLRVRSGNRDFAVLSSELEAVQATSLENAPGARLGELGALLGFSGPAHDGEYRLLARERRESEPVAVGVDMLGDFEDVLVTPLVGFTGLPQAVVGVTPFQGAPMLVLSLRALLDDPALPRQAMAATRRPARRGPLLLVVDDSLTTRSLVSGILESHGYRVLSAADGQQGLELARTEGLAGIVSDLQMPILDGLGFLEKLREDPETASLPFVLLTSIDDVATFEKASGLGADRCLGKQNFSQELLLKTLRELL